MEDNVSLAINNDVTVAGKAQVIKNIMMVILIYQHQTFKSPSDITLTFL